MHTSTTASAFTLIADPLTPWWEPDLASDRGTALVSCVTSSAPVRKRIAGLQEFWGLSGTSTQLEQWDALAATAAIDVAAARMLEPHLDALGILAEAGAGTPEPGTTWGVFAAEAPGTVLSAIDLDEGTVHLIGEKPWCSLASQLSHAIVTAYHGQMSRAFAVSLTDPGVHPSTAPWPSLGLSEIPSGSVTFDYAQATVVGPTGWYLDRPSFAWGGIRVAACWFGGALGLARNAAQRHFARPQPSPLGNLTLGQLDAEIFAARSALAQAALAADGSEAYTRDEAWELALRVRNIVYRASQRIAQLARELAGPAALTGDRSFAKADADLTVYLSQHHGARDEAALGDAIVTG